MIMIMIIFLYFQTRRNNSQHTANSDHTLPQHQNLVENIEQTHQRTNSTDTQNASRNSSRKVTELLNKNARSKYNCPQCNNQFSSQGITRHVRSCAPEWCRANGIRTH